MFAEVSNYDGPPSNPSEVNVKILFQIQHAAGEATMDGGGLLKVGGRNNKLKKRGENAPRPCIDRGEWRLGLQSRAGATKHRDNMQVGIL